ncbi:maltose operon protein [Kushneria sinocarnis]|uniref:Maltose operon protein n=1 Tax=Kushneria sinocarnis TaxID=595502 RepID=A0A420WW22_9GAMM|nr:MalM family protein [Kushneria sinocarnis]RKR03326.1 maltose operon protein [Kushneria sinocarnis]
MKRAPLALLTSGLLITLSGCAAMSSPTTSTPSVATGQQALSRAADCCDSLASLPYQSLQNRQSLTLTFDANTPAHHFSDGKSFFHAFALPDSQQPVVLQISSPIEQEQVVAPTLLLLDDNFQPVRRLGSDQLTYQGPNGFRDARLGGAVSVMPGPDAAYIVLYTSDSDRAGSTSYENPEKTYARVRGLAEPALPDPVADHAATGRVTLEISPISENGNLLAPLMGRQSPTPLNASQSARNTTSTAPAAAVSAQQATAASSSRQREATRTQQSELDYRRMIRAALKAGDIELAMQLADRAESAGQTGTRAWLAKQLRTSTP